MWPQKDILTSLDLHLVSEGNGLIEIEVLEESLCELGEGVGVSLLFSNDHWKGNLLDGIVLEDWHVDLGLEVLDLWLVGTPSKEESDDHVSHQVLASELNNVEI